MGLFDRFKKKGNTDDQVIKKMTEWIEHPMEFGKKPDEISILDKKILFWPTQQEEECYLLKYSVDKTDYIGFTGPISWSFFDIDLTKVDNNDLFIRYTGWCVVFYTLNSGEYDKSNEGADETDIVSDLEETGYSEIECIQKCLLGNGTNYEFIATKKDKKVKLVGIHGDIVEHPIDSVLPFYDFVGQVWDPFNL